MEYKLKHRVFVWEGYLSIARLTLPSRAFSDWFCRSFLTSCWSVNANQIKIKRYFLMPCPIELKSVSIRLTAILRLEWQDLRGADRFPSGPTWFALSTIDQTTVWLLSASHKQPDVFPINLIVSVMWKYIYRHFASLHVFIFENTCLFSWLAYRKRFDTFRIRIVREAVGRSPSG